jgi:CxxC motif-containing protein (DUF1111 family)
VAVGCLLAATALTVTAQQPAKDPGVRKTAPGAGGTINGLTSDEKFLFDFLTSEFVQAHSVTGNLPNESGNGLGPGYNANGCGVCHSFPAFGGSSPLLNPQIAQATLDGARNVVPSFLSLSGPVREARFVNNPDGSPDGGVHNLFTIQGRVDAPGCKLAQPDFAAELARNNVIFRIPTPMFGAGLIENIPDSAILAFKNADVATKNALGIFGRENRNGNDGTMTRFGWKAQNKSLMMFSGEAYNVEMGVTNDLFSNERNMVPGCNFNTQPEDHLLYENNIADGGGTSGMQHFATFGRLLAPPTPWPANASTQRGSANFNAIGCVRCHKQAYLTDTSDLAALSQQYANLYSDLLIHHMGTNLADGVTQGLAGPDDFRTAPLWGVGQRYYFLHDGRTSDLIQAILAHQSPGSEANKVIANYLALTEAQQQDLLNFLRSL